MIERGTISDIRTGSRWRHTDSAYRPRNPVKDGQIYRVIKVTDDMVYFESELNQSDYNWKFSAFMNSFLPEPDALYIQVAHVKSKLGALINLTDSRVLPELYSLLIELEI